jgi:hypothetical protein
MLGKLFSLIVIIIFAIGCNFEKSKKQTSLFKTHYQMMMETPEDCKNSSDSNNNYLLYEDFRSRIIINTYRD